MTTVGGILFLSFDRDLYRQTTASVAVARHWPSRQVVRLVLQIRIWARVSAGRGPRHVLAVESRALTPRVWLRFLMRVCSSLLLALMARNRTS